MDYWLSKKIQSLCAPSCLRTGSIWLARAGFWVYIIYGIVQWFRPGRPEGQRQRRRSLLEALFSVLCSSLMSYVLARIWRRPRPFAAHRDIRQYVAHKDNASFPSNHTMNAFAAGLAVFYRSKLAGLFLILWSLLIGFSRIVCGIHYVSDILGGLVLGLAGWRVTARNKGLRWLAMGLPWLWTWLTERTCQRERR